jgi:hypothetical protein
VRSKEESLIGGSYRRLFCEGCLPFIGHTSKVLELGPGKGSWTRAILPYIPDGVLHTVDFQDVTPWLKPEQHQGRLVCHQVKDSSFSMLTDRYFDFFWSVGVLCHNNLTDIGTILRNALPKMKPSALSVHQYGAWEKLDRYGWGPS